MFSVVVVSAIAFVIAVVIVFVVKCIRKYHRIHANHTTIPSRRRIYEGANHELVYQNDDTSGNNITTCSTNKDVFPNCSNQDDKEHTVQL